nr:SMI1/KNR4 family protein [Spirosomataceae bacterium]
MITSQLGSIKGKLDQLRQLDTNLEIFGSEKHKYVLNPPLLSETIEQFETKYKVNLPTEYVAFLTILGNGGAGPFYGLEPFENILFDDLDYKHNDGLLNPSKPFLHSNNWNLVFEPTVSEDENEQEYDRQYEEFTNSYFDNEQMNGVIAICNYGCGISLNLVVNGQEYGHIWTDDRGNDGGIYPTIQLGEKSKISFLDWYELWLDNSITEIKSNHQNPTKQANKKKKP